MPLAAFPKCFLDALCAPDSSMPVDAWIDLAADNLDIDGLEFYSGFTPIGDARELKRLRARAAERGLAIPMLCASPDFTQPDPAARAAELDKQKRVIDAAAVFGCVTCRVLSGQRRPGVTIEDGVRWAAEGICECIAHAESSGVVLVLENHYKDGFWRYPELAQSREAFLSLLAAIPNSPWFGVNYDPSNAVIAGDDPIALLDDVKSRIVSMHASDRLLRGGTLDDLRRAEKHATMGYAPLLHHGVIGEGLIDYDAIFRRLREVDFSGWISIEDGQDPHVGIEHLRRSAVFLRAKMHEYGRK